MNSLKTTFFLNSDPRAIVIYSIKVTEIILALLKMSHLMHLPIGSDKFYMLATEYDNLIPEVDPLKASEFNLELNAEITKNKS